MLYASGGLRFADFYCSRLKTTPVPELLKYTERNRLGNSAMWRRWRKEDQTRKSPARIVRQEDVSFPLHLVPVIKNQPRCLNTASIALTGCRYHAAVRQRKCGLRPADWRVNPERENHPPEVDQIIPFTRKVWPSSHPVG